MRRALFIFISLCLGVLVKAQLPDTAAVKHKSVRHVAYGTQPDWMVSGSVSEVSGTSLQKSFTPNLGNTLVGRLPGLTVMQGGLPASGGINLPGIGGEPGLQSPTLRIRGTSTFGSGKSILVIVDGIESSYEQLVPEEIESVTELKDAAATAMFGSKGANGVLLVTTKRGIIGPLKISFSTQQGFSQPTKLPNFLGSVLFANLYDEAQLNDGVDPAKLKYNTDMITAYETKSDPYLYPDVNWYKQVLRNAAPTRNYDMNFSGGTDVVKYFVLMNLNSAQGFLKQTGDKSDFSTNSDYKKFNFRSNVDINLSNNLSTSLTLAGTVEDKANPVNNNLKDFFSLLGELPPNAFPAITPSGAYGGNLLYSNPLGDMMEKGFFTSNARTFQSTLKFTEKLDFITPGLSVSALASFNNAFTSLSNKSRTYIRFAISSDVNGNYISTPISQNTALTSSESESNQWRNLFAQAFLNYDRTFGETSVSGVLMSNSSNYVASGGGLPNLDQGLYGRMTLTNRQKYIGEFSFGYNASEGFPKGGRWGFFPSVSLGWVVSNENFLKGKNAISYLKLRGSYGLTGNDAIGAARRYMWFSDFVGMNSYYFGTTSSTSQSTIGEGMLADSSITWEKQKQMNIGFEATLFNHVDVSLDVFNQDRYDILASPYRTLPQFLGISNVGFGTVFPQNNVGKVNNKGLEASLGYRSDNTGELHYYIKANAWYAINKIIYNAEAIQLYDYLYRTGRQVDQPFMLQAEGFFADQTDINNSAKQNYEMVVRPGDIKYTDQNDDHIIDQNDYAPAGNPALPTLSGSLNAGLLYKGFDFDIMFQGVTGNSVYVGGDYYYAFQNNGKVTDVALGRWTPETAATATYPRLSSVNNLNNYRNSSFWQKDGSYIKLRSLEIGYTLPQSLVQKVKLENARIFINGTNLFSWDHMDFTDPEMIYGYPAAKTFSFGARILL